MHSDFFLGLTACAMAAAIITPPTAHAQDRAYPAKPITIVVGYPAGGSVDAAARVVGESMAVKLGANVVIENVGGASGAIGVQKVANASPDGYTLAFGANSEFVATRLVNPTQRYDASRDLVPVGLVGRLPFVLLTAGKTGISTTEQFLAALRKHPGNYSYGTSGVGSLLHLAGEQIKKQAHAQMTHIPYRGAGAIANDLMGGSIDFAFMGTGAAKSYVDAGRLVAIAVTSPKRVDLMPNVPALAEHPDLKGYDIVSWYAMMAPRGTSPAIIERLRAALRSALGEQDTRAKLDKVGVVIAEGDEDLGRIMLRDTQSFKSIVDFAKIGQ